MKFSLAGKVFGISGALCMVSLVILLSNLSGDMFLNLALVIIPVSIYGCSFFIIMRKLHMLNFVLAIIALGSYLLIVMTDLMAGKASSHFPYFVIGFFIVLGLVIPLTLSKKTIKKLTTVPK